VKTITATPQMRYRQHKANAKRRGIEFDMSFDEWWALWRPHFENRGRESGQVQMCRTADDGAYRPGNVRIDSVESNQAERRTTMIRRANERDWTIEGEDRSELRDWLFKRRDGFHNPLRQMLIEEETEALDGG